VRIELPLVPGPALQGQAHEYGQCELAKMGQDYQRYNYGTSHCLALDKPEGRYQPFENLAQWSAFEMLVWRMNICT